MALDEAGLGELIDDGLAYLRLRPLVASRPDEPAQLILTNQAYFPALRNQDDIFEGKVRFRWRVQPTTVEEVDELIRRQAPEAPDEEKQRLRQVMLQRLSDPVILRQMQDGALTQLGEIYERSSIMSFFKDPRVQRYWADYADRGRGYGLIFTFDQPWTMDTAPGLNMDIVPFPVNYVHGDRPTIELAFAPANPRASFEDIEKVILTKSDEWENQREERLFRVGIPEGLVPFPPQSLKALILGYGISAEQVEALKTMAREREIPIPVFAVAPPEDGYRLDARLVQPA